MQHEFGKLGAPGVRREHLGACFYPPRGNEALKGSVNAVSMWLGPGEPEPRRSGRGHGGYTRRDRGEMLGRECEFTLEEVLREWVLPRDYRGELPTGRAHLRALARERERRACVREERPTRPICNRWTGNQRPQPPPARPRGRGPIRMRADDSERIQSPGVRIRGDAGLWEDSVPSFFPRSPTTTAPDPRKSISMASFARLSNEGANTGGRCGGAREPTPVEVQRERDEDDPFATPPIHSTREPSHPTAHFRRAKRWGSGGRRERRQSLPPREKAKKEVDASREAVMGTEATARPKLDLATIRREYRNPLPGNRGIRSRFHPLHQEWKEQVAELIKEGVLDPLPEARKPVGDDPFGSEPASTPREHKMEIQEVEEAPLKTERGENVEKAQEIKSEARPPVEMVETRTSDSAMDVQGDFDYEVEVKREEAGVGDANHPDQRQVSEQQQHWVGAVRPILRPRGTSLSDTAPLAAGDLEGEKLWALLDPGSTRSFVSPKLTRHVSKLIEKVNPPFEFLCAGGKAMTATEVICEATLRMDQWCGKHPLYVSNLGHDMILGYDFLTRVKAVWDFGDRTIRFSPRRENEVTRGPSWLLSAADELGSQPVQVQGAPAELKKNFSWAGPVSARQQGARERFRANPKNRVKFVLGENQSYGRNKRGKSHCS